jgi:hypothetical protein
MSKEMSVKDDLKCIFNMPEKIKSEFNNEEEMSHFLPPHDPVDAYPVDEYESCPNNWMNGSDIASSYFLGVKEDHGMWMDFNECFYHTHDVAVVISIQGVNPITGQKMVAEKALKLEQYHKKCPVHNVKFQQDRYCPECGFKWPGQNYLSTTGTPETMLWLDGFRTPEGKVRQYVFTEDKMKGVASQMIGEERVFAIGIAYYLSKHKKPYMLERPKPASEHYAGNNNGYAGNNNNGHSGLPANFWGKPVGYMGYKSDYTGTPMNFMFDSSTCSSSSAASVATSSAFRASSVDANSNKTLISKVAESMVSPEKQSLEYRRGRSTPVTPVKKLEIGAGALIKQRVYDDPKMMSYWEEEPAGMIYINYCDEATKKKIIDGGRRADVKDGFMNGIKVGG